MPRRDVPGPGSVWSDPAVGAGFAAAYDEDAWGPLTGVLDDGRNVRSAAGDDVRVPPPARSSDDAPDDGAAHGSADVDARDEDDDRAALPLTRDGRRQRAPQPGRLSPGRAVAGAAVSVAGVALGIGTLLWVTEDPSSRVGPVVEVPAAQDAPLVAEAPVETEAAPVDPPPVAAPPPAPVAVAPPPAAPPAPPPPPAAPPVAKAPSLVVPVTVLNNSNRTGLADRAAARFERGGWPVRLTGNFRGQIPVTTVYYDPGLEANARAFARRFEGIVRVRPRFPTLPARGVVVVLTREFAA